MDLSKRNYDQWYQVYRGQGMSDDEARRLASSVSNYKPAARETPPAPTPTRGFASGVGQGFREGVGSLTGAVGSVLGGQYTGVGRSLQGIGERMEGTGYTEDLTGAGRAGRLVGRVGTELGAAVTGGGLALRGATALPKVGSRVARALESGSRLQRGTAYAVAGSPVDVIQGMRAEDGFLLPGTAGAIAENIALSGAAGAILPPIRRTRPDEERIAGLLPPGQEPFVPREAPETRPRRMIPRFATGPIREAGGEVDLARTPGRQISAGLAGRPERLLPAATASEVRPMRGEFTPDEIARRLEDIARSTPEQPGGIQVARGARTPSYVWDPEQGRFVVRDKSPVARMAYRLRANEEAIRKTEERIAREEKTGRLFGRADESVAPQLEASAETGRRLREASGRIISRPEVVSGIAGAGLGALGGAMAAEEGDAQQAGVGAIFGGALAGAAGRRFGPGVARGVGGLGRTEAVSSAIGAGVGGLSGAGAEDPVAGALTGAAIGAGAGLGAGRLARIAARRAEAAEARPPTRIEADIPAGQTRPTTGDMAETRGFERIDYRASPYPRDFPQQPRTMAEWDEFYDRMAGADPAIGEFYRTARESGQLWNRIQKTKLSDIDAISDQIAKDVKDLAVRSPSRSLAAPELWALEKQLEGAKQDAKRIMDLRRVVQRSGDEEALRILDTQEKFLHNAIYAMAKRQGRDRSEWGLTGRVIQEAMKESNDPRYWIKTFESAAGRELTGDEASRLIRSLQQNEMMAVKKQLESIRQSTFWDQAGELYQAGLLTSLMRPARDLFSSLVNVGDKSAQMAIASGIDKMLEGITGVRTVDFDAGLFKDEMVKGLQRGYKGAMAIMRGGGDPEVLARAAERYDFSRESLQSIPFLKSYTTWIRRTIGAPDQLAFEAMYSGAMSSYARTAALNSDAVRNGAIKKGSEAFNDLVVKYMQSPPKEIDALARSMALEATFQNSTKLGNIGLQLRQSESEFVRFFGKWFVPFVQTPASITTQSVEGVFAPFGTIRDTARILNNTERANRLFRRSPEAIAKIAEKMDLPETQARLVKNVAKSSTAWGWIGLGYALADGDKMTSWFPANERERRRWELEGRTEAAIKVGGTWVSMLGLLGPQAQLMTIGAGIRKMLDQSPGEVQDFLTSVGVGTTVGVARSALDSPMLQGIRSAVDLGLQGARGDVEGLQQAGVRAAEGFVGGWVPQIVQQAARSSDVTPEGGVRVREVRVPGDPGGTIYRAVAQGIPGARQTLPTRLDALGRERAATRGGIVPRGGVGVPPILSPARLSIAQQDPIAQELWRTNAAVPRTPQRQGEPREAYEQRVRELGEATYKAVERTINSTTYKNIERRDVGAIKRNLIMIAQESGGSPRDIRTLEALSDEEAIARLQGAMLEKSIRRARSSVNRRYPDPLAGRSGTLTRTLTR